MMPVHGAIAVAVMALSPAVFFMAPPLWLMLLLSLPPKEA